MGLSKETCIKLTFTDYVLHGLGGATGSGDVHHGHGYVFASTPLLFVRGFWGLCLVDFVFLCRDSAIRMQASIALAAPSVHGLARGSVSVADEGGLGILLDSCSGKRPLGPSGSRRRRMMQCASSLLRWCRNVPAAGDGRDFPDFP